MDLLCEQYTSSPQLVVSLEAQIYVGASKDSIFDNRGGRKFTLVPEDYLLDDVRLERTFLVIQLFSKRNSAADIVIFLSKDTD